MSSLRLSVIVVSRHRPEALRRCLTALKLQDLNGFEVVVVADSAALTGLGGWLGAIKSVAFDEANISAARNLGLGAAAGDVVAFIDDDAVAEPTWASRLLTAFKDPKVVAATGFVRGRNGISMQWKAAEIDTLGDDHPIDAGTQDIVFAQPAVNRAIKTVGTNAAFRADILRQIGGFDPAFRFYLDDSDVNLRMAHLGKTAIIPFAQVQHGFDASERRRKDRTPLSLFEIAASSAVFLGKHAPERREDGRQKLHRSQRQRLVSMMVDGRLEPNQVTSLMHGLELGWANGMARPLTHPQPLPSPNAPFKTFSSIGSAPGVVLVGRSWQRRALLEKARIAAEGGAIVTCICLSATHRPFWQSFHEAGFWEISGGLWGKSDRSAPRPVFATFANRVAETLAMIAKYRPIKPRNMPNFTENTQTAGQNANAGTVIADMIK